MKQQVKHTLIHDETISILIKLTKLKAFYKDKHKEMLYKHYKIWSKIKILTKNNLKAELVYKNETLKAM